VQFALYLSSIVDSTPVFRLLSIFTGVAGQAGSPEHSVPNAHPEYSRNSALFMESEGLLRCS
jgi:hypothetical protein